MEKIDISDKINSNNFYKFTIGIIGAFIIYSGIIRLEYIKIILGFTFVYFSTYKRELILTKEGIYSIYGGIFRKKEEFYEFIDIDEISITKRKDKFILYIVKNPELGPMARKFIVDIEKYDSVINILKNIDKNISFSL